MANKINKDIMKCNLCGQCNIACSMFTLLKKETYSNRHKASMIKECKDKELFKALTDSSVKRNCPASIDLDEELIKARYELNKKGIESKTNKELIDNLSRYGHPLGRSRKGIKPYFC